MSIYDERRKALGLSPAGGEAPPAVTSSAYAARREELKRKLSSPQVENPQMAFPQMLPAHTSLNEPQLEPNAGQKIIKGWLGSSIGSAGYKLGAALKNGSFETPTPYLPNYQPKTLGDKALNLAGGMLGDAGLWIGGDMLAAKALSPLAKTVPISKVIGKLGKLAPATGTGVRAGATYGALIAPAETALHGDGLQGLIEREKQVPLMALGGTALHGVGQVISKGIGAIENSIVTKQIENRQQAWQDVLKAYKTPKGGVVPTQSQFPLKTEPNLGQTNSLPEIPIIKGSKATQEDLLRLGAGQQDGKMGYTIPQGYKERGFSQTVADSPNTASEVSQAFKQDPMAYKPITNAESVAAANKRISDDLESAVQFVKMTKEPSAEHTTTAIQLINKFQNEGNFNRAIDIVENIAPKLTKAGQSIQAASIYDRLSPEGILLYAQRRISKLNNERLLPGLTKEHSLTSADAENLKRLAGDVQNLTGDAKTEASQELQAALQSLGKSGLDRKLESAQTIAQLLNPKTLVRNTVGNEMFFRLERINKYVTSPIDWARSAITGSDRTVTFRTAGQGGYWEGFLKGVKAGWKGVNPQGLATQYDLTAPAFTGKLNPLTYLEKALGATLKGFDYAAYSRAANQTIGEMAELAAINLGLKGEYKKIAIQNFIKNADKNILEIADQYGKYVTFQDQNVLSKGLSAVKRGLNLGKEFGAGSIIVKYPKTPGALIMRGLDYSPAGFLRSAYQLAQPILKGKAINSRDVMLSLSRAITGSLGFTGLGWFLADNGVITGQVNKDKDVRELEKATGGGSFKVNASALSRWVKGGFNPEVLKKQKGDTLVSYDWAQPIAMAISFGANMAQNVNEGQSLGANAPSVLAASAGGALDTIAEQPVLQGLLRVFQGYSLGDNFVNTLKSVPASFSPTLVNQIRQIADNTGRSTYDPDVFNEAINMVKNKIPGLEASLPTAYTTEGKPKELYQNSNWFNVFFNPSNITNYKPTETQTEILRIYNSTGDKIQFPRVAAKSFKWQKENIELTGPEYSEYQRILGQETEKTFSKILSTKSYPKMTDTMKAQVLQKAINNSNDVAKREILKSKGLIKSTKRDMFFNKK